MVKNLLLLIIPLMAGGSIWAALICDKIRSRLIVKERNTINIAFESPFLTDALTAQFEAVSKKFPRLEFMFYSGSSAEITELVLKGWLHFGFIKKTEMIPPELDSTVLRLSNHKINLSLTGNEIKCLSDEQTEVSVIFPRNSCSEPANMLCSILTELSKSQMGIENTSDNMV
ncbi:MAG: hypothetical protein ACI4JE_06550 [Ruminococcus sp.]